MNKIILMVLFSVFLFIQKGYSWEDWDLYYHGVKVAKSGEADLAFMDFHEILIDHSDSKFFKDALFGLGEYYFSISDYYDSIQAFRRFVSLYPKSEPKLFALAYLMKIARNQEKEILAGDIEKEIIRFKHTGLLFKEFNEYKYESAFSKKYKALYFIDRIEIYINNELFAKIIL